MAPGPSGSTWAQGQAGLSTSSTHAGPSSPTSSSQRPVSQSRSRSQTQTDRPYPPESPIIEEIPSDADVHLDELSDFTPISTDHEHEGGSDEEDMLDFIRRTVSLFVSPLGLCICCSLLIIGVHSIVRPSLLPLALLTLSQAILWLATPKPSRPSPKLRTASTRRGRPFAAIRAVRTCFHPSRDGRDACPAAYATADTHGTGLTKSRNG